MNDDLREQLSAELPAPRDDEPSSLRQDILDELADHLLCATQREQLREGHRLDADTIWQRVLRRFGSPSKVARQLWFDWMWEKIAMQRFTMSLMCLVVVACGAMLFMMQRTLQSSQEQQMMLMEQLAALTIEKSTEPQRSQPTEWNRLKVKVVRDENGNPVAGANVEFIGVGEQTKSIPSSMLETDESGMVDFGLVLYGKYIIRVRTPDNIETSNHHVSVHPGQDREFKIAVPETTTRAVKLKPKLVSSEKVNHGIDEARLWYLTVWGSSGEASKSYMPESTEPRWQAHGRSIVSAFVSEHGHLPVTALKHVDAKERFDGLLVNDDIPIHRFASTRYIVPHDAVPQATFDVPLGHFDLWHQEPYIEMKLIDGRTILTQVPQLHIPLLLGTGKYNTPAAKQELNSLRQFANGDVSLSNYYRVSPGFVTGEGAMGMMSGESYGSGDGLGGYGGSDMMMASGRPYQGGGLSTAAEAGRSAFQVGSRLLLTTFWEPFVNPEKVTIDGGDHLEMSGGGYGEFGGGMGYESQQSLHILPEFVSSKPCELTVRLDTDLLENVQHLRNIGSDRLPFSGLVFYPSNSKMTEFRLTSYSAPTENDEAAEVSLIEDVKMIALHSTGYSSVESDGHTFMHLLMTVRSEDFNKLGETLDSVSRTVHLPSFFARPVTATGKEADQAPPTN